jgi:hypothetical protein
VTLAQLVVSAADPLKVAVTVSVPTGSVLTFSVATPPTRLTVPRTVPPTVKVTVPDAVPPPSLTFAVNVTPLPCFDERDDWVSLRDVVAWKLTAFDGAELAPVPAPLVAETVNV